MHHSLYGIGATFLAPKVFSYFNDHKIEIVHAMPGRLRIRSDKWKNEIVTKNLQTSFYDLPLIKSANANPLSGSLLLTFNSEYISQQDFDHLMQYAVEVATFSHATMPAKAINVMEEAVLTADRQIKKKTAATMDVDSVLILFLLVKGLTNFSKNPTFSSTLLYWAYSILNNRKD